MSGVAGPPATPLASVCYWRKQGSANGNPACLPGMSGTVVDGGWSPDNKTLARAGRLSAGGAAGLQPNGIPSRQ
ncbi:hypothetical protein BJ970_002059 [Saccharopolyspora phatthalungensis]|uniref:Uncharacterized protein n=1 Tax=Saccharopolyspora phatthalungensis TaxID=664693 RepID=A0A840Q7Z4_9PSEU|nr:hypothetical protein [Saccharopolyspora phatthalungensis]